MRLARHGEGASAVKREVEGAPPSGPVWWVIGHKNGRYKHVLAQTAYCAVVRECGWTFSETVSVVRADASPER